MARPLSPEQRRKAKALIAKHKGVKPENIPDSSIELALGAGTITMSDLGDSGINSYNSNLGSSYSSDTGGYSSSSSDSGGSSGGGCD